MFNQGGLSLDQAPPISVVLRFFVTGALFGIAAGVVFMLFGEQALNPQNREALLLTHMLTLGVMASFMLGALFQMLPVIAGVVLQNPIAKATFVHLLFTVGTVSLLLAFAYGKTLFYLTAGALLGIALLYATAIMIWNVSRLQNHSSSSKGMLAALIAFSVTILTALYLVTVYGGVHAGVHFGEVKAAHYSFGLFGWIAILIVSISFQVIEMFYVTPPYPKAISRYFTAVVLGLLLLKSVIFSSIVVTAIELLLALLFILYAAVTIHRLYRRKRPTSDATVWFWRFGMAMLIVTMIFWISGHFTTWEVLAKLSYGTFAFFAVSIVLAMVYKIVPFLVWFHLSNQGYMKAPLMHDIIHPKSVKKHFYLHTTLFVIWLAGFMHPLFFQIAGLLAIASFGWLFYHLMYAVYLYRHTQKYSEKIKW
jgi:hypothetical protein